MTSGEWWPGAAVVWFYVTHRGCRAGAAMTGAVAEPIGDAAQYCRCTHSLLSPRYWQDTRSLPQPVVSYVTIGAGDEDEQQQQVSAELVID